MKTLKQLLELWEHPFSGKELIPNVGDSENNFAIQDLHYSLSKHYAPITDKIDEAGMKYDVEPHQLSNEELDHRRLSSSLEEYKLDSGFINKKLIEHYKDPSSKIWMHSNELETHDAHVNNLRKLATYHKTPHDLHVYSGVGFHPAKIMEHGSNYGKLHLPAFTSTSIHPKVAATFAQWRGDEDDHGRHLLKIHVPEGSHGYYVNSFEHELILPNNSRLHVHPEPQLSYHLTKHSGYKVDNLNIWHAKLVHDGFEPTRHME